MTRATGRSKVDVVLLDAAWGKALPGVERLVRKAARAALGVRVRSLTVALSDDRRVQALNKRDRKKDKPTNVLSFPAFPVEVGGKVPPMLGDIVLAAETVAREAELEGKPLEHHISHLVIHGLLHLLGHDHEDDGDAEAMEAIERSALARLAIPDPYA